MRRAKLDSRHDCHIFVYPQVALLRLFVAFFVRVRQWGLMLCFCLVCLGANTSAVLAVDPVYQPKLQRLSEILGALYFLRPLCGENDGTQWRAYMAELIVQERPDDERRARIVGAFNQGYSGYARLYLKCTPSARVAMQRYLAEGEEIAKEIHTRYTE